MKQLVCSTDSPFQDFRDLLVESYKKSSEIISGEMEIVGSKIIINGNFIPVENTMIFNKESYISDISDDYLFSFLKYNVDSSSLPKFLTNQKSILFSYLSSKKIPIPAFYLHSIPPGKYCIEFTGQKPFDLRVIETSSIQFERIFTGLRWNLPFLQGLLIYFYLNKPIVISNILLTDKHTILIRLTHPVIRYLKFENTNKNGYPNFVLGKITDEDRKLLNTQGMPRPPLLKEISKIPRYLNSASIEVLIGDGLDGLVFINAKHTHEPFSSLFLDEKDFKHLILKTFWNFMDPKREIGDNISCL